MTKLNMSNETAKPMVTPAPADVTKHDAAEKIADPAVKTPEPAVIGK